MSSKNLIKKEMYTHIRAYNRHLTLDHLVTLDLLSLLRNCHPIERIEFAKRLSREGLLSDQEMRRLTTPYERSRTRNELYGYGKEGKS